jgi:hypothetical protein
VAARAERNEEVNRVAMSGVVRAMRERLAEANEKTGRVPSGIGTLFVNVPTAATILAAPAIETIQHVVDDADADEADEAATGDIEEGGQAAAPATEADAEEESSTASTEMPELVTDASGGDVPASE